jgi:hypothetical protein
MGYPHRVCSVCLHVARCRNREQWDGWMETMVDGGVSTYQCAKGNSTAMARAYNECTRVARLSLQQLSTDAAFQDRRQRYGSMLRECLDKYSRRHPGVAMVKSEIVSRAVAVVDGRCATVGGAPTWDEHALPWDVPSVVMKRITMMNTNDVVEDIAMAGNFGPAGLALTPRDVWIPAGNPVDEDGAFADAAVMTEQGGDAPTRDEHALPWDVAHEDIAMAGNFGPAGLALTLRDVWIPAGNPVDEDGAFADTAVMTEQGGDAPTRDEHALPWDVAHEDIAMAGNFRSAGLGFDAPAHQQSSSSSKVKKRAAAKEAEPAKHTKRPSTLRSAPAPDEPDGLWKLASALGEVKRELEGE